ncbi:MAG: hypothetical protein ACE5ER_00750 [Nitrospinaceae bacterium]
MSWEKPGAGIFWGLALWTLGSGFTMGGFDQPHAVVADPPTGRIYVSNIQGPFTARDHRGYISLLNSDGKPIHMHFILSGRNQVNLNAPKGMAIIGPHLFVADLDQVHRFDKATGRLLGTVDLSLLGVRSLTGLAAGPEGMLYAADMPGNAIYRINTQRQDTVSLWIKDPGLDQPTGLVYDPRFQRLLIGTWNRGKILFLDRDKRLFDLTPKRFKGIQGLALDRRGDLVFSAMREGKIYRLRQFETLEVIRKNLLTPAMIGLDRGGRRVLIPSMRGNILFTTFLP